MKCTICNNGDTSSGFTTVSLQRAETTIIIKQVPAEICENCGEYYLSDETTEIVLHLAEQSIRHGAEVEILRYVA
jgi:YgiT-type zinc finger domain-containing protein